MYKGQLSSLRLHTSFSLRSVLIGVGSVVCCVRSVLIGVGSVLEQKSSDKQIKYCLSELLIGSHSIYSPKNASSFSVYFSFATTNDSLCPAPFTFMISASLFVFSYSSSAICVCTKSSASPGTYKFGTSSFFT